MLKKTFLITFALFSLFSISSATAQNPSIGFIVTEEPLYSDDQIYNGYRTLYFSIKNTGDEVLNNIEIVDNYGIIDSFDLCENNGIPFNCNNLNLETLNPDEIITMTVLIYNNGACEISLQFEVTANTPTNNQINDFSDHSSYDYNNYTWVEMNYANVEFMFYAMYVDLNNNSMVDVGDVMEYTLNSSIYIVGNTFANDQFSIFPNNLYNNETVTVTSVNNTIGDYVTVTYALTAADIAIGYAFYKPDLLYNQYDNCHDFYINQSSSCFNCPIPAGCFDCIITNLTGLTPNRISGQVTFDTGNDGCATGTNYPNRRVRANTNGANFSTFTNSMGEYSLNIPNYATYNTFANLNLDPNFSSNPGNYIITSTGSDQEYNADFCISSATNFTDLKVLILPINDAVPGFTSSYKLILFNQGSTVLDGSVTLTYNDTQATLLNESPASNSSTSNSITWDFTNLLQFKTRVYGAEFTISVPPIVQSNDVLTFTATTTQNMTDDNPVDNQFTLDQIAVNSFDPNDKTILEGAYITPEQANGYLHFLTRFQNEGTSPAINVVIQEELTSYVDANTFEPVASSHDMGNIQLIGNNKLKYTFTNINLPHASQDEEASHGWILYKAKPVSYFSPNHVLTSKSDIYFDFNPAIVTNTATTQIGVLSTDSFVKDYFKIFPNPAKDQLNISALNNEKYSVTIIDLNGREVYKSSFIGNKTVDVTSYQSGFYVISVYNNNRKQNFKLIKE